MIIIKIALESAGGNTEEFLYAKNKFKARAEGTRLEDGSSLVQEVIQVVGYKLKEALQILKNKRVYGIIWYKGE